MATKKRESGEGAGASPAKKKAQRATGEAPARRAPARKAGAKTGAKPRIHASHASAEAGAPRRRAISADVGRGRIEPKPRGPTVRKAPLGAPSRARGAPAAGRPPKRTAPAAAAPPEPSNAARELALSLAAAGIDKKALGIEILDVTGKVDYADFLVVMTGRSDRHVHAIATGIEEAMHKRKRAPLSTEGLAGATWVLLDFGDVVVHVFQEEARALYDIEGLWIDASRVPVPDAEKEPAAPRAPIG